MLARWTLLLRRLALVLGIYTVLRGLFLLLNFSLFRQSGTGQIAMAFLQGLRFDLSAIAAINLVFIVLTFLPRRVAPSRPYEMVMKSVFIAFNLPFLLLNIADLEYFQFTGRRSTLALASMAGDAGVKWSSLIFYYWPLLVLAMVLAAALFFCFGQVSPGNERGSERLSIWIWLPNLVLLFPLALIGFRGGLQYRPISPAQAMPDSQGQLAQLALNSSFTLLKSYKKATLTRCHYFADDQQPMKYLQSLTAAEDTGNLRTASEPALEKPGPKQLNVEHDTRGSSPSADRLSRDNVIILILESFSAEYWGVANGTERYTPFLDSLAAQSLFFPHNYANGRRSIEAAPSILAGLPSLMTESLLESVYQNNQLLGLGTLLAPYGYTTSFFHGAANGTMRFDTLMRRAGIQRYYGLHEYPNKAPDFDGHWGIFDEPYLQYVARELTRQQPPFAAAIFTLSSHQPYSVPEKYRGRFKKGTLAIHESIGYTDFALEQFFATARQQPWYSNTLFVITGDHTSKLETQEYLNPLGHYRVPLLFFQPRGKLSGVETNRVTQHADILPSVLDYLQIKPERRLLFGHSIFRSSPGRAVLHINGHYWLVRNEAALDFAPEGPSRLFDLIKDPQLKSPLPVQSELGLALQHETKALVQYFINGTLDNKLYCPMQ